VETSILSTKLLKPPIQPRLVSRPRLFKLLDEVLNYKLILVSAPAGFGKTTLLSEWVHYIQPETNTAWFSLDDGDNDPVRFWDYFIAALRTIQADIGEEILNLLHSHQSPISQSLPIESILTPLINQLSNFSSNVILILDDYHLITSQSIHDSLIFFLDHIPPHMHLIIAARSDPPLPLTQYRGKGTMLEIRTDDLRFRLDEATNLLEKLQDLKLSPENISTLNERIEGWVTGLKMAALSIPRQENIPEFVSSFSSSQRYIMDYLIEEVLKRQSERLQDFLLKTSILERFTASLCDAVTGQKNSREILLELEHNNMFTIPLDETREWYRYEHLFRDLLSHQLEMMFEEPDIDELHRKASQWYEENNYIDFAIHHALIAQEWDRAARLILGSDEQKRLNGEFVTVVNWIQQIPVEVIHGDIELCILYCNMLLVTGQFDSADAIINFVEQSEKVNTEYQGLIYSLKSYLAFYRGDNDSALELGNNALSMLPPDRFEARSVLCAILGSIHWQKGNIKEAEPLLTEAYEIGMKSGQKNIAVSSLGILAAIELLITGKLQKAVERYQKCIELAGLTPSAAIAHRMLGWIFYEWNDLDAATFHTQKAIDLGKLVGLQGFIAAEYALLARCKFAQGDEVGAVKAMEESCLIAHNSENPDIRAQHAGDHILLALRQNNLNDVVTWGSNLAEDIDALPLYYNHIPPRLLIARGEMTAATEKLNILNEEVKRGETHGIAQTIQLLLYQALAADTTKSALRYLADVFAITESEGYIRTFVDESRLLAPLLKQAISRGIYPEYASKLLTIIESEEQQKRTVQANKALLSKRELEVLTLLADGLSNQQISDILVISLSTTKNHIHNILEKFNVQSRTQAISRARELQLI
jgi:LuxR family maltose regulon positive regulatory protein